MKDTIHYKTSDRKHRDALRYYTSVSQPLDLKAELGVARFMLADAVKANQTELANALLLTIAGLADAQIAGMRP